jgi:hypothetical protein
MTIAGFGSGPRGASVASSAEMSVCLSGREGLLIAPFMTDEGVGAVLDFMPIERPETPTGGHRLVRVVRIVRGTMRSSLEGAPRFD